tara:strand:+ start:2774 stop:4444 length:1671 start_codon:yes stop_codon:yes gene_type:complete
MNKSNKKLILEEYSGEFKFEKINKEININFNRVAFIYFVFIIIFILFTLKIFYLGNTNLELKNDKKTKSEFRSTIIDRNDVIIAKSVITKNIGINPNEVADKHKLILNLKLIFPDKDYDLISKKLDQDKFFYIEKQISQKKYKKIFLLGDKSIIEERKITRIYPQENLFSHIIGQIDDNNLGVSGIEKYFDYELKTSKQPLKLSLDTSIQHLIRNELISFQEIFKYVGSSAILMNINNGEVISMVSLPDYDLNKRGKLNDELFINRATKALYEVGSVFKTFTFAAALDEKLIKPDTQFNNLEKKISCAGNLIREYEEKIPKNLTAEDILIRSGNIGSVRIGQKIGIEKFKYFLKKLGLLDPIEFDILEVGKPLNFNWGKCKLATISFGHGITTTALHLSRAYAIISNGGYKVKPTLIKTSNINKNDYQKVLNPNVSNQVNKVLRKVVESKNGTAGFANVSGYNVGGKTGTAQKSIDGRYSNEKINTFVSIFPSDNPKYVLLVLLDEPKTNKEYIYNYRDGSGFKYKGNWRNTAGWTSVEVAGKIIEKIGPILATKY